MVQNDMQGYLLKYLYLVLIICLDNCHVIAYIRIKDAATDHESHPTFKDLHSVYFIYNLPSRQVLNLQTSVFLFDNLSK